MRLLIAKASAAFNKLIELGAWGGPLKSVGSTLVSQMGLSMASCLQPEEAPPASPRTKLGPEHWGVVCNCGLEK